MKNFFTLLLFIFITGWFLSCKKDSMESGIDATYYIKGKKDGTEFNFTSNAQATTLTSGGVSVLHLIAGTSTSEAFNIGINVAAGMQVKTGIYREDELISSYMISGLYNPNSTTFIYSAGVQSPSAKPLTIKIISNTNTEVSGTFSGAFYKQNIAGTLLYNDYITITEGEFKLPVK